MTLSNWGRNEEQSQKFISQFSHRTINHKNLQYTLRCSNVLSTNHQWHWSPIINPSCHKHMLYPPLIWCQSYSICHKSWTSQAKIMCMSYIFLDLSANWELKIQNIHHYRNSATFSTSEQLTLNDPANGPAVIYSKIQNRLCRTP